MDIIAPIKITGEPAAPITSSGGSYWDRTGLLVIAAPNTPRITYDPADLSAAPYLLLEAAATNMLQYSNDVSQAAWAKSNLSSVGARSYTGPQGANSAWYVVEDTSNGVHELRTPSVALVAGTTYTQTVFAKAGARQYLRSGFSSVFNPAVGTSYAVFDLVNGAVAYTTGSVITADCKPVGGGWYRCRTTMTATASVTGTNYIGAQPAPFAPTHQGDGASGIYLGGVQLEAGADASSYISTDAGAAVTRAADTLDGSTGLLWSNIVENDADDGPLWNPGTAYTVGQKVRRPNHRTYSALQASTGKTPEDNTAGATPYWQDVGPTKRYAVFDNKYSTIASAATVVCYLLRPGAVSTALATLGLDGSDVRVSVVDASTGTLVYRKAKNLRIKNCRSMSEYWFKPIARRADEVFDDLPPFKHAIICVTVTKPGSTAAIADIVTGRLEYAGETQWAPEIRTKRRSVITDDGFGNLTFNKRRSSKLLTADVSLDNGFVDDIVRLVDTYTAEPCVIIGDARWTTLIILGFITDFRLVLESPAGSIYNAQIEGFA